MTIYEPIPIIEMSTETELVYGLEDLPELVHLEDAAYSVFHDFSKHPAATITADTPIDDALHEMKSHHTQLLLVERNNNIIGVIGTEDILGEKPLRLMQTSRMSRTEITVGMLMKRRHEIVAIEADILKHAKVGHILKTIKTHGVRYVFVTMPGKETYVILGVFSVSQLAKQLHTDIRAMLAGPTDTVAELSKGRQR